LAWGVAAKPPGTRNARVARIVRWGGEYCTILERSERMDIVYIGLTVGFFVVSWAFVVACDHLS
jgi:hypothetical protein